MRSEALGFSAIVQSSPDLHELKSAAPGPRGRLPLTAEMLRESRPSGDIFGLTQNAGCGIGSVGCGSGSCGGRRPSLADYVRGPAGTREAPAAGGC